VFAATEAPEVADVRKGQTLLTTPNSVHLSKRLEAWHDAGGRQSPVVRDSGIRESYLDPTSTTNAQNSRTNAYAEAQCWHHLLWGCWPILHIEFHGFSFL